MPGEELQQHFRQRLWDSDIRYFQAAAQNIDMLGGQLSFMEGLSSQAGACVFHSIGTLPSHEVSWLQALETNFVQRGVRRSRLYLQENRPEDEAFLKLNGYRPIIELGMAGPATSEKLETGLEPLELQPVREALWPLHRHLLSSCDSAPDGHRMQADDYATLERRKVEAGYMQLFLYLEDGKAQAIASLDIKQDFARTKNLLIHPARRGEGLGKSVVASLMAIARQQGASAMGAYALSENKAAYEMYRSAGMEKVYQQYEWVKLL